VLQPCESLAASGFDVVVLPVNSLGQIDLVQLERALIPETLLVSVQWANNETGVLQPVEGISSICRSRRVPLHVDAAQAFGKATMDLSKLPVDFVSMTAHKIHGPAGVGALYVRNPGKLVPLLSGGPQEGGLRAGTENLAGIAGFGRAAQLRSRRLGAVVNGLRFLRDRLEKRILQTIPDVSVNGDCEHRLVNSTNLRFAGVDGQALVSRLDQAGVFCSQSSACTNRRPEPSYVLRAMGLSEPDAYASIRFSISELNTVEEIDAVVPVISELCRELRLFAARRRNPYTRPLEVP
jgi:cysteine desulfurase